MQRSKFDRSHGLKTTLNAGDLVPIFVDEALPGDTFSLKTTTFGRIATPLHPVMENIFAETFFFAVPLRIIWDNWERFNGAQDNPGDSTDFLTPILANGNVAAESLGDHFGLPIGKDGLEICSFWHRAYNRIFTDWFRSEDLQDGPVNPKDDGPDQDAGFAIRKRGKRHDYFTSCLIAPQKGDPVQLPLGGTAPVSIDPDAIPILSDGTDVTMSWGGAGNHKLRAVIGSDPNVIALGSVAPGGDGQFLNSGLTGDGSALVGSADLSAATAATINQIRQAFQIQRLLERDMRGGTRYTEILRAHFNVTSDDARLQRAEFLGGGTSQLMMNPVPQTSADEVGGGADTPQGNLAAYGVFSARNQGFVKSFTEHCVIIGLISIRADLNYQQGLPRMFSRRTRFDFYWPALAHLGEQAVLNREIFAQGSPGFDDIGVFGYQERYAEYRYKPSMITSQMRSSFPQSLDVWHLAQDFADLPVLGDQFIREDPPIDRIIAVQSEPQFLLDVHFDLQCARPMPTYSVPGMVDHF